MQSRTQYLIFLTLWAGSLIVLLIVAAAFDFDVWEDFRLSLFLSGLLALAPSAAGYVAVQRCRSLRDRWRAKRGHDVYQERQYEDAGGFIHLSPVPPWEAQEEIKLSEIVAGMQPIIEHPLKDSDDS